MCTHVTGMCHRVLAWVDVDGCATDVCLYVSPLIPSFLFFSFQGEEYSAKQKEVEQVANPIMRKVYGSGGAPGGAGGSAGGDEDFGDDEL